MNATISAIRERMAHGYNQTPSRQSLEDIYDLLGIVDRLVKSHLACVNSGVNGCGDCATKIAEELGVDASPTQA